MNLLLKVLEEDLPLFHKHRVRIRVLGQIAAPLPKKVIEAIKIAEKATEQYNNKHLLLCLNYGGQQEIADAVQKIMLAETPPETVTPELIEQFLYAPDVPPCDLVVRTSGEQRLSNFMLWRSAYSELMFIDKPWPDMTKADVTDILATYEQRNRRFGG
jgi:undecaprenyl diphosphate synthase